MQQERQYDAIVVGDGQSGGPLSTTLVRAGRKTAVIEREHIGGTCINTGCTPTKTMIASARVAYLAGRAKDYGVEANVRSVDMKVVRKRKRDIVEKFRNGSKHAVEAGGVDIIMGEARFTGPKSLEVRLNGSESGSLRLSADTIFINTGTSPAIPPIPGLDSVPFLDSTSIMELDAVPEHLLILGGGYIALEFGQMFRRFGSRVTIVEQLPRLLMREDADMAEEVTKVLCEDGIELLVNSRVTRVERGDDSIRLVASTPDGERTVSGTHLLVAVGRKPETKALDLAAAGVACDEKGFVKVNERLETTVPGIYAMGDVAGTPAFTHVSYDDFRIIRANLLEGGNRTTRGRLTPYVIFIDPQFARVGLSEEEARKEGRKVRVAKMPMSHVARALEVDESRGAVKVVVDAETDLILGFAVLGLEGGEIMAMADIAMIGKVPYPVLQTGIFAHPTLAELLNKLFEGLSG